MIIFCIPLHPSIAHNVHKKLGESMFVQATTKVEDRDDFVLIE
jgi:hypothetical protein